MGVLSEILGGHGAHILKWFGLRPDRQQSRVLQGELQVGNEAHQWVESANFPDCTNGAAPQFPSTSGSFWDQANHSVLSVEPRTYAGAGVGNPSGSTQPVYDLINCGPNHRFTVRGGPGKPALIVHNCVQAVARDVFADCLLRLDQAGIEVIFHAHDEAVCLVDADKAEESRKLIKEIMSTPPEWMPDLPQSADAQLVAKYTK